MPVTARLLQRLHESLGDEATSDLFAWWEEAATVNRAAIREVADLYYARFEARLEKGLAEVRTEWRSELDRGLSEGRSELAKLRSDMDKGFAEVRTDMDKGFVGVRAELDSRMANQRADLVKWMFAFWLGTVFPLAGLIVALNRL